MSERFIVKILNYQKGRIKDRYGKCPLKKHVFEKELAKEIATWLNENVKDYRRFELKELKHHCFRIWDNELEEQVKFNPLIHTGNPKSELLEYVDWLNSLVEGSE